jgi:uncharacterized protein (TIGR02246 family)
MSSKASTLVAAAKTWAGYYGDFANGPEGAAYTAVLRFRAAWDENDADAVAAAFTAEGSLLLGDEQLRGREEIRDYLAEAFAGGLGGSKVSLEPVEVRLLTGTVALAVTEGGTLPAGTGELSDELAVRALWVLAEEDGTWKVASQQTSPLHS